MSSAICSKLDQSKVLSSGNGLICSLPVLPNLHLLAQSPNRVVVRYPHHTPLQWAK